MATFYFKLRDTPNRHGEYAFRLFITIDKKVVKQSTGYSVGLKQWDDAKGRLKSSHPNSVEINEALEQKLADAKRQYAILDKEGIATVDKFKRKARVGDSFYDVAIKYSKEFEKNGQTLRAIKLETEANQMQKLFPGLKIKDINANWAEKYRKLLIQDKYAHNSIVTKLNVVASIVKRAAAEHIISGNPLENYKTGSFRESQKPKLTRDEIDLFWNFIPSGKWQTIAKISALMSYYCSGARFLDILLMSDDNIYVQDKKKRMRWMPSKTKNTTGIYIECPIHTRLDILIKQAHKQRENTDTILGVLDMSLTGRDQVFNIKKVESQINDELKMIMLHLGIQKPISFNDMRRSLADHTEDIYLLKGILGHGRVTTTEIYKGKNQQKIDEALYGVYGA